MCHVRHLEAEQSETGYTGQKYFQEFYVNMCMVSTSSVDYFSDIDF